MFARAALARDRPGQQIRRDFLWSLMLGFVVVSPLSAVRWGKRLFFGEMDWFAPLILFAMVSAVPIAMVWSSSRDAR